MQYFFSHFLIKKIKIVKVEFINFIYKRKKTLNKSKDIVVNACSIFDVGFVFCCHVGS